MILTSKKKRKQKYKEWRMDTLRDDDFNQMNLLAKELSKMRRDDKVIKKQNTMRSQN
jgi:hypothetical protein